MLSRQFDVDAPDDWQLFYDTLVNQIKELIKYRFEHLMWILYRIDVDETKAMDALSKPFAAQKLADLIVERQVQKWKTRKGM